MRRDVTVTASGTGSVEEVLKVNWKYKIEFGSNDNFEFQKIFEFTEKLILLQGPMGLVLLVSYGTLPSIHLKRTRTHVSTINKCEYF